ncbi:MAG: hypothetical protein E7317_02710 [Clostridiales bacterium]|nr:hypothetical protein [Clostridiales bacterium]
MHELTQVVDTSHIETNTERSKIGEEPFAHITRPEVEGYFGEIQTAVFLPQERIKHIRDQHSDDYDKYSSFIRNAIEQPEIILEDHKNPNTAMFIGKTDNSRINVLVKLAYRENAYDRSFIVTMFPVGERSVKKLERRNKTIYNGNDL